MLQSAAMANEESRPPRAEPFDPFGGPRLEVRTPEAIAITRPIAGFGSRSAAMCIDVVFLGILGFTTFLIASLVNAESVLLAILLGMGEALLYFTLVPRLFGETPGKRILRIRVVLDDGRPATLVAYLLRTLALPFDAFIPLPSISVGMAMVLLSKDGKRLGDFLAGTVVVRDDAPAEGLSDPLPRESYGNLVSRSVELPIQLVRALRSEDLVALRGYLSRRHQFSHVGLAALRRRLADHYARRLGLPQVRDEEAFLRELYLCLRDERSALA